MCLFPLVFAGVLIIVRAFLVPDVTRGLVCLHLHDLGHYSGAISGCLQTPSLQVRDNLFIIKVKSVVKQNDEWAEIHQKKSHKDS